MNRPIASALALLAVVSVVVSAQSAAPGRLEFAVASIKRHAEGDRGGGGGTMPDGTIRMINNPIIGILGGAYPSQSGEYINLPDWARTERYDIILKPPTDVALAPRASRARAEQNREMMRALFADRMKLAAHDEMRDEPTYALVLARPDGKLGPNLKSRPDCIAEAQAARAARGGQPPTPPTPPLAPPSESEVMKGCGGRFAPGRLMIGGTTLDLFAQQLRGLSGRFVENRTGLDGWYSIELQFAPPRGAAAATPGTAADPNDPPEIFTALQEQLGLKLEPARRQLQVVVIDHIERPTEN